MLRRERGYKTRPMSFVDIEKAARRFRAALPILVPVNQPLPGREMFEKIGEMCGQVGTRMYRAEYAVQEMTRRAEGKTEVDSDRQVIRVTKAGPRSSDLEPAIRFGGKSTTSSAISRCTAT